MRVRLVWCVRARVCVCANLSEGEDLSSLELYVVEQQRTPQRLLICLPNLLHVRRLRPPPLCLCRHLLLRRRRRRHGRRCSGAGLQRREAGGWGGLSAARSDGGGGCRPCRGVSEHVSVCVRESERERERERESGRERIRTKLDSQPLGSPSTAA